MIDLWDDEQNAERRREAVQLYLSQQNELARRSAVFATILRYERPHPDDLGKTERPNSLVRNAMITQAAFSGKNKFQDWEQALLNSPFYAAAFEEEQEIEQIRKNAGLKD